MTDVERVGVKGDKMETQCWICPQCHDDHNPGGPCSPSYEDLRKECNTWREEAHKRIEDMTRLCEERDDLNAKLEQERRFAKHTFDESEVIISELKELDMDRDDLKAKLERAKELARGYHSVAYIGPREMRHGHFMLTWNTQVEEGRT